MKERASVGLVEPLDINPYQDQAKDEVTERLVNLSRMFRLGLSPALENESPRQAGHVAIDLRVAQIPEPDERTRECDGDCQVINEPHEVYVIFRAVFVGEPDHAEDKHHSTAMACQAAFPDLE